MKACAIGLLAVLMAMTACTKLPLVNAPREKEGISLVQNAHYDAGSKIRYMVSNDNTHVYLRFDTDNYATIVRIRKYGAIVHFDTEGKKKGPFWLKYPVYLQEDGNRMPIKGDDEMVQGGYLQRNLFPPTTAAIWHQGTETRAIDLGINAEKFVCKAGLDSTDVLVYMVGVPFQLLGVERPEDLSNLNMLLEIPASPDEQKPSGNDMSNSSGVPGGSMAGSTMPGQNGGGMNQNMPGSMGGGMTGGALSSARQPSGPTSVRIWMEVKLSPTAVQ